jgi:hypothetical protein
MPYDYAWKLLLAATGLSLAVTLFAPRGWVLLIGAVSAICLLTWAIYLPVDPACSGYASCTIAMSANHSSGTVTLIGFAIIGAAAAINALVRGRR